MSGVCAVLGANMGIISRKLEKHATLRRMDVFEEVAIGAAISAFAGLTLPASFPIFGYLVKKELALAEKALF